LPRLPRRERQGFQFIIMLSLLMLFSLSPYALGEYSIQKCVLTVYRDGVVYVYIEVITNETEPLTVLPLLSSQDKISDLLACDENGEALEYDINEDNTITIYSLGAKRVTLEYDTTGLTSMEYGLWTLKITAPFDLTVRLPEKARIIYLSGIPSEIKTSDSMIELSLYPGEWEINYEVPAKPPSQLPTTPPIRDYSGYIIVGGVGVAFAIILLAIYIRGKRAIMRELSEEEAEVVKFIKARGGRCLEAELRERFPHIPRTSMWRLIRRLERRGIVQVKRFGLQNVVELK